MTSEPVRCPQCRATAYRPPEVAGFLTRVGWCRNCFFDGRPSWVDNTVTRWSEDECGRGLPGHTTLAMAWKEAYGDEVPEHPQRQAREVVDFGDEFIYRMDDVRVIGVSCGQHWFGEILAGVIRPRQRQ